MPFCSTVIREKHSIEKVVVICGYRQLSTDDTFTFNVCANFKPGSDSQLEKLFSIEDHGQILLCPHVLDSCHCHWLGRAMSHCTRMQMIM